jgi:hypothetical protein
VTRLCQVPAQQGSAKGQVVADTHAQFRRVIGVSSLQPTEMIDIMDWVPILFVTFKVIVLCTGMFYAIKWHYDQGKKGRINERRAVLRASGQVVLIFVLSLLLLGVSSLLVPIVL